MMLLLLLHGDTSRQSRRGPSTAADKPWWSDHAHLAKDNAGHDVITDQLQRACDRLPHLCTGSNQHSAIYMDGPPID
jgi:hypothetical protein